MGGKAKGQVWLVWHRLELLHYLQRKDVSPSLKYPFPYVGFKDFERYDATPRIFLQSRHVLC